MSVETTARSVSHAEGRHVVIQRGVPQLYRRVVAGLLNFFLVAVTPYSFPR